MGTGEGQGPPFPGEEPLLLSGVSPKGHSALGPPPAGTHMETPDLRLPINKSSLLIQNNLSVQFLLHSFSGLESWLCRLGAVWS